MISVRTPRARSCNCCNDRIGVRVELGGMTLHCESRTTLRTGQPGQGGDTHRAIMEFGPSLLKHAPKDDRGRYVGSQILSFAIPAIRD